MAFHVRYTPYALSKDVKGFCEKLATKYPANYTAHQEDKGTGDQASLHYHIYINIPVVRKTITNQLQEYFDIPKGIKGQTNAYYMVKEIKPDLLIFTHGYIQKDGNLIATNIDANRRMVALEYYKNNCAKEQVQITERDSNVEVTTKHIQCI